VGSHGGAGVPSPVPDTFIGGRTTPGPDPSGKGLNAIIKISLIVPDTQVLFRVEKELLEALDTILSAEGFKTRNEWFRAQIRRALDEATRRRVAGLLERLTVEGVRDEDIVDMVREWRLRKTRR